MATVAVVGAGWAGAVCARELHDAGHRVEVFEAAGVVGGHARVEVLDGVVYEPNGAHIFHTSNPTVAAYVQRFGLTRPYEHAVVTEVYVHDDAEPILLSWPPQVDELRELDIWPVIERELAELPDEPTGDDFESYVQSMMGPTLYRLFVEGYTVKQWGRPPSELSSRFAPKRVELRRDGYRRLFRDRWELFPERGVNAVVERVIEPAAVTLDARIWLGDLEDWDRRFDAVAVTAPLDDFVGRPGELEWRGISMQATRYDTDTETGTVTPAYVVNRPSLRVPYTRTVETKHATGQRIGATVVCEEYPGSPARHYPVATVDGRHERRNLELKAEIAAAAPVPVDFCGRLANYQYINQDEAIAQGIACAARVGARLAAGPVSGGQAT